MHTQNNTRKTDAMQSKNNGKNEVALPVERLPQEISSAFNTATIPVMR